MSTIDLHETTTSTREQFLLGKELGKTANAIGAQNGGASAAEPT
jgi:hypothetical protein